MDEVKKSIRPSLNLPKATTENEKFQNEVLRPILKLQHPIIILLFKANSERHKIVLDKISDAKIVERIHASITSDIVLKNQYIGMILGQFTVKEYNLYAENSSEFNKRILNMIQQRLHDSILELKE